VFNEDGARAGGVAVGNRDASIWNSALRALRVHVVGAGTVVGRELCCGLLAAGHPRSQLVLSARQERSFAWKGDVVNVAAFGAPHAAAELAFLCSDHPEAHALAADLVARGSWIVDVSETYRERPEIPLVAPGVNLATVGTFTQVVALPTRSAVLAAQPLFALERAFGIEQADCVVMRSAAADGTRGIVELRGELGGGPRVDGSKRVGNLAPTPGEEAQGGLSHAERAFLEDQRRLLGRPDLTLDVTAVRVDVERCDGFAFHVTLRSAADPAEIAERFAECPGLAVDGSPQGPCSLTCPGSDRVHVGRIRTGSRGPASVCFFAVGDQLRFGAARAAMQVAARFPAG